MQESFNKLIQGYKEFRKKYVLGDKSVMQYLSFYGQKPRIMVVACCDARVDPALILQCDPGDLFVVRNVANIVPPYEKDEAHHGTSAALEFGICFLKIKHLVLLGHSQCGGIKALRDSMDNARDKSPNDFINNWVSIVKTTDCDINHDDDYAKLALQQSLANCMTFPWISSQVLAQELTISLWFFDIKTGKIFTYSKERNSYEELTE